MSESEKIGPILQDLAQMTSQKTHSRLELSVVTTLLRLPQVASVCMMDLRQDRDTDYVLYQFRQTGAPAAPHLLEESAQHIEGIQPLQHMVALQQAIAEGRRYYTSRWQDGASQGHSVWLILWRHQKAIQCIELRQYAAFDDARMVLISAVFQVYQNYHDLLDYSERDALTGLLNRKTFDDLSFQLLGGAAQTSKTPALAQRRRTDLEPPPSNVAAPQADWLAMIDIDSFKHINDQFGHLYGDEVLILVANLLRQNFRNDDRIFRYGGEEFVVLLQAVDQATVLGILERLRQAVADFHFPQVGQVTISIGFTRAEGQILADLLDQADRALYYVKQHGKNQVAYYQDLLALGRVHLPLQNSEADLF